MNRNTADNYWQILNNFEDLLRTGYRKPHEPLPAALSSGEISAAGDTETRILAISNSIKNCSACSLGTMRKNAVPGEGSVNPRLVVIGEAPGANEDATGRPFVGAAGQYLDKWLKAIGLNREESVYIANVIKCRPPDNRDPGEEEIDTCFHFLTSQLELLKPDAILCVGRFAGRKISGREGSMNGMRGRVYDFNGIPVIVTYHPSAVLRNPDLRRPVWEDLKIVTDVLAGTYS